MVSPMILYNGASKGVTILRLVVANGSEKGLFNPSRISPPEGGWGV